MFSVGESEIELEVKVRLLVKEEEKAPCTALQVCGIVQG
jgi:hypothetical protein